VERIVPATDGASGWQRKLRLPFNLGSAPQAARLRLLQTSSPAARAESIEDGQSVAITDASLNVELGGYGIGLYRASEESADR